MEKSVRQRIREEMENDWKTMRVPTKEERDFAVANRNIHRETLCCKVAEAYANKTKLFLRDLEVLNTLMRKSNINQPPAPDESL